MFVIKGLADWSVLVLTETRGQSCVVYEGWDCQAVTRVRG